MNVDDRQAEEPAVSLDALSLDAEPGGFEAHLRRVRAAATAELRRRAERLDAWGYVARWAAPALAASLVLAALALVTLARAPVERGGETASLTARQAVGEALGLPDDYVDRLEVGATADPTGEARRGS